MGNRTRDLPVNRAGNHRGMNPGSRANMSKPGETHNPRGAPDISLITILKQELALVPSKLVDESANAEGLNKAQLLIRMMVENALDGNVTLARDILDRVDGKSAITLSSPGGGPLIEISQNMNVISKEDLQPALEALVNCGVVQICAN